MKTFYHISFLLLLPAVLVFSGCGDNRAPAKATGTVSLDGRPVANATVMFSPVSGERNSYGFTDGQGRYELRFTGQLKGAVVGEHRVDIRTGSSEATSATDETGSGPTETIPAKYNTESELTATLRSGNNTVNFELTSN